MVINLPVDRTETVSCSVCHREIPRADALSAEGQDYLLYFCGLGCYEQWQHGEGDEEQGNEGQGE